MLDLTLRSEFMDRRLRGTAIDFENKKGTGALQKSAREFFDITYPTQDVLDLLEASQPQNGLPICLKGVRGQGKSHLMAMLYHAIHEPQEAEKWLQGWGEKLGIQDDVSKLDFRSGFHIIAENLNHQRYKYLWDLIFDRHPRGEYYKGKWEGMGNSKTDVPPYDLFQQMFQEQPTTLVLDEFQTWYEGLTNTKQFPWKNWAFSFIQNLSEIAKNEPENLLLVVSVREEKSDAYEQIHRVNPTVINFAGINKKRDRMRLLLHRLFENRSQIPVENIRTLIGPHLRESTRLENVPESERETFAEDFIEAWPFSPRLFQLLEDQILIATSAQETRDMIRILANLFRGNGQEQAIITAADFRIDADDKAITSLLDSVTNSEHNKLRDKAIRNLESVRLALKGQLQSVPHLPEILSSLWLRSLSYDRNAGADPHTLQIDITRKQAIDDNAFELELSNIVENSFNIHQVGDRLVFKTEENPHAKLTAFAKNDNLFVDHSDTQRLRKEIEYLLGGSDESARAYRVIVIGHNYENNPWGDVPENHHPDRWQERIPIIVFPHCPGRPEAFLGKWLKQHVNVHRNTVRFLLPAAESSNIYHDKELTGLTRKVLKSDEWRSSDQDYAPLFTKFKKELEDRLAQRFPQFAILENWNYAQPEQCKFLIEAHNEKGKAILSRVEDKIRRDLFIPEEFEDYALSFASSGDTLAKLVTEMKEPRPGGEMCIPWLGEVDLKERLLKLCAKGKIVINLKGLNLLHLQAGESEDAAELRIRREDLGSGRSMSETTLLLPSALSSSGPQVVEPEKPKPPSTDDKPSGAGNPPTSAIFGGGGAPATHVSDSTSMFGSGAKFQKHSDLNSPLNLLGKIENWGVKPQTAVERFTLRVDQLSGAQVKELIQNLPEGLKYMIELEKASET